MSEPGGRNVTIKQAKRVWGEGPGFRLFLSHRAEEKRQTSGVKAKLEKFGISAFVAHNDIEPTQQWQIEIENALATMDGFAALMTPKFFESIWCNQEVGYAVSRGVPIVPVCIGKNPKGFIAQFQSLTCEWDDASSAIAKTLIRHPEALDAFISALPNCSSFDMGNEIACVLPRIEELSMKQAEAIRLAYNGNSQLRGSFGFNGKKPSDHGAGLARHLKRLRDATYAENQDGSLKRGVSWI